MDLLDDLDIGPIKATTFRKTIDIRIDDESEDEDANVSDKSESSPPPALTAIDVSKSSILNQNPSVPSVAGLFGSVGSLLDKVKRRLNGEDVSKDEDASTQGIGMEEETHDTQEIANESTDENIGIAASEEIDIGNLDKKASTQLQTIEAPYESTQLVSSTQVVSEEAHKPSSMETTSYELDATTQKVDILQGTLESNSDRDSTQKLSVLFDSEADEDDFEDPDDEVVKPTTRKSNKLFMDSDSENEERDGEGEKELSPIASNDGEQNSSTQTRLEKIQALVDKKRAERLLRAQQERDKEQKDLEDYKTLNKPVTDEDNEEQEGDVSVSTVNPVKTKTKLEEEMELLEEQTEEISEQLQHEEKVVKKFDKNSLLAAFGIENSPESKSKSSPTKDHSSPITSPFPDSPQHMEDERDGKSRKDIVLSDSSSEEDNFQVSHKENGKKLQGKDKEHEQPNFVLKTPFNTNAENHNDNAEMIELGSESESDEGTAPSKVTRLEVKSKFSRQTISKAKAQKKKVLSRSQLLCHLKERARNQLKKQKETNEETHKAAVEEVATEQEAVDKLLDRYIAAANRTREKEQEIERRRKLAEEAGEEYDDAAYSDESDYDGEVPDSDLDEEADDVNNLADSEQSDADNEGDDEDEEQVVSHRHRRKAVMSDDEDDEADYVDVDVDHAAGEFIAPTEGELKEQEALKSKLEKDQSEVSINLGSFGGNFTQKMNDMLGISMTQAFESESPKVGQSSKIVNVFDQLRNNNNKVIGEESFVESSLKDKSFSYSINSQRGVINFDEASTQLSEIEPPTQVFSTQKDSVATLHDSAPQDELEATVKDDTQDVDDDDLVVPAKRRLFRKPVKNLEDVSEEDEEDEEETEEQAAERVRLAKELRERTRAYELEQKRKKLEMKRKGIDKIMENEAEESEDEWQGIGGYDGERSDEENSEDEKMLDDFSKVKLNKAELDKLIAKDSLKKDEEMLHKILNDVNNGGFRKRGARNGVELEFSDEEDAYLQQYNRIRNQRMREKMMENGNLAKLSKDERAKAFFETITEESQTATNEIFGGVVGTDNDDDSDSENKEDDPFNEKAEITKDDFKDPSTASKKRKFKITEAYVQKTLSFLQDDENLEIEQNAKAAAYQHGFLDDDDDFTEDLSTLKQRSIIKLPDTTPRKKSTIDLTNDSDQSPEKFFKMPSKIMKSFQSNSNDSFKNSNEVTVSTAYKAATSSKASIMSFGKNNSAGSKVPTKASQKTHDTRVLKVRRVEKSLKKGNRLKGLDLGNFE